MSLLLDLLYLFALLLASPWILYRLTASRAWRLIPQRCGIGLAPQEQPCVWLHGSSVGEVGLLKPLIALFEREMPQMPLVISSYTQTGLAAARAAYPAHRVVVFPLDFSSVVKRFLRRLRPRLVIIVESEFWPNFLAVAEREGIPAAVVNGKMSAKSFALHRRTRFVARAIRALRLLAVQSEEHAARFRGLGVAAHAIRVTGNMKYDLTVPPPNDAGRAELRAALGYATDAIIVIGGSLHAGEDAALLQSFDALPLGSARTALILVPRYPAEAEACARHVLETGRAAVLKSAIDRGAARPPGHDGVLIVDTVGQLGGLYAAADVAFVGGSLFYRGANKGGHNLMEPAIRGLPVLFGPYNFSFKDTVEDLLAAGAGVLVRDAAELDRALAAIVSDPARGEIGERARAVVLRGQGATARNFALLAELLDARAARLQPLATNRTMPQETRDLEHM
jgi:3-deoxy-D-manno-octulosonic-acid transferase